MLNRLTRNILYVSSRNHFTRRLTFLTTELHMVGVDRCSPCLHMIRVTIRSEKSKLRILVPAARMMRAFITKKTFRSKTPDKRHARGLFHLGTLGLDLGEKGRGRKERSLFLELFRFIFSSLDFRSLFSKRVLAVLNKT